MVMHKDRHQAAVVFPQVTQYVKSKLPILFANIKAVEERHPDQMALFMTWQLFGKRPKIRNAWQFKLMMERSLCQQLGEMGVHHVKVDGWTYNTSFDIRWERPLH